MPSTDLLYVSRWSFRTYLVFADLHGDGGQRVTLQVTVRND